jgi:hypothetical protein
MGRVMEMTSWASYGRDQSGGRDGPCNHRSYAMTFVGPCSSGPEQFTAGVMKRS